MCRRVYYFRVTVFWSYFIASLQYLCEMEKLTDTQQEAIKRMSKSRLIAKLLAAGVADEEVEKMDKPALNKAWAEIVHGGKDKPGVATAGGYDPEIEREKLAIERHRLELEARRLEGEKAERARRDELEAKRIELEIRKLEEEKAERTRTLEEEKAERVRRDELENRRLEIETTRLAEETAEMAEKLNHLKQQNKLREQEIQVQEEREAREREREREIDLL
jgi:hypothetical protein